MRGPRSHRQPPRPRASRRSGAHPGSCHAVYEGVFPLRSLPGGDELSDRRIPRQRRHENASVRAERFRHVQRDHEPVLRSCDAHVGRRCRACDRPVKRPVRRSARLHAAHGRRLVQSRFPEAEDRPHLFERDHPRRASRRFSGRVLFPFQHADPVFHHQHQQYALSGRLRRH